MGKREQHGSGVNAEADGRVLDDAVLSRGSRQRTTAGINRAKILVGVAVVAALSGAYGILSWTGALTTFTDGPTLERYVVQLGILGPLAIIGAGRITAEPRLIGGSFQPRHCVPLSLTFDHRAVIGGEAARFFAALIADLELAS